jgi:two-component sensor histidine kinase
LQLLTSEPTVHALNWSRSFRLLRFGSLALPLLVLIAWGWWAWESRKTETIALAGNNVELIQQYAHSIIQSQRSLLLEAEELLQREGMTPAGLEAVHLHLARLVERFEYTIGIAIASADGEILVASQRTPGVTRMDDRSHFRTLRDGGVTLTIDRTTTRLTERNALVIAMRRPGDGFNGVLVTAIDVRAFTDFFGRITVDERASASLLRRDGALLVRHTPDAPLLMLAPDAPAVEAISRGRTGVYRTVAVSDGIDRFYAFAQIGDLPIYANYGAPAAAMREAWQAEMMVIGAFLGIVALLGFYGTTQTERRVRSERARQQAQFDRRLLEEAQRTVALRETLLREVHHRTKNNLQTIQSLIKLRGSSGDARTMISEIEQRIWAIAEVHDLLYSSQEFSRLDLGEFLHTVCANPAIVPPESGIDVRCRVETVEIDLNAAVPLALIVVELVTNAIKHAFPDKRAGTIDILLTRSGEDAELVVRDNGIGLPKEAGRNSGLRLVRALVGQVGGEVAISEDGGAEYRIRFQPGQAASPPANAEAAALEADIVASNEAPADVVAAKLP